MSLILVKAPVPVDDLGFRSEGMDINSTDVTPGRPPPFLIPYCKSCDAMVERFTIDYIASPFHVPIQYQCHGQTGGMKVSYTEVLRASREGGLLWVFTETKVSKHGNRIHTP